MLKSLLQRKIITRTVLIIGIVCVIFAVLTKLFIPAIDNNMLSWFADHRLSELTVFLSCISTITKPIIIFSCVFVLCFLLALLKPTETKRWFLFISTICTTLVIAILVKILTSVSRPPQNFMVEPFADGYSFPSSHVLFVTIVLIMLVYLIYSNFKNRKIITPVAIISFVVIALVTISRLYLGHHWFSDVLASFGFGLIIFGIFIKIEQTESYKKLENTISKLISNIVR